MNRQLEGRRILVVEDEYLIAVDVRRDLAASGAVVIGPVPSVDQAVELLESGPAPDAALLDVGLNGTMIYPVADALIERGIPFVFATGYDRSWIPERFSGIGRIEKPIGMSTVVQRLTELLPDMPDWADGTGEGS